MEAIRLLRAEVGDQLVVGIHAGLDVVEVLVANDAEHALREEDLLVDALAGDLVGADVRVPHARPAFDHVAGQGGVVGALTIQLEVVPALGERAARGPVAILGGHQVNEAVRLQPVAVGRDHARPHGQRAGDFGQFTLARPGDLCLLPLKVTLVRKAHRLSLGNHEALRSRTG